MMKNTKIIIHIFICAAFLLLSLNSYGQIALSVNKKQIKDIIPLIEQKSDYRFFYNSKEPDLEKTVTIQEKNASIKILLDKLLADTELSYVIKNENQVVLTNKSNLRKDDKSKSKESDQTVSGIVYDENQVPLIGVIVRIKGISRGTQTDIDGRYQIPLADSSSPILTFTYLGYKDQEVLIDNKDIVDVVMQPDITALDEIIVVGYGVQKKINKTASVSSLNGDDIKSLPVSNISNAMGGRVSGLITRQTSGEPGADASALYLRGNSPYVLVDGIEREWNKINMEEVESITLLKDASAVAPYGLRGANGVVLITTKRGQSGKLSVSYNADFSYQKPTNLPSFLSSSESLKLKRQAWIMDGQPQQAETITDEMIANYEKGSDKYPNTDWVDAYLKSSMSQKHSVILSGGNDVIRAHAVLSYLSQGNMLGSDFEYDRYNLRSNLDIKATPTTNIGIDVSISNDKKKSNIISASEAMQYLYRAKSTEANVYSNGLPTFVSSIGTSIDQMIKGGGNKTNSNAYQNINLSLNQELPFIKGLSFKFNFNYNTQREEYKYWREPMISYIYNPTTEEYDEDNEWDRYKPSLSLGNTAFKYYTTQGFLNYSNQWGAHGVSGLIVYERRWGEKTEYGAARTQYDFVIPELNMGSTNKENQSNYGTSNKTAQDGLVGRVNYDYLGKYFFEFAGRYDRTFRYAPGRRDAFFPSASIGWRISEEGFIKNNFRAINNLKIRASYGKSGNPVGNLFSYLSSYSVTNSYVWGLSNPIQEQGLRVDAEPNSALTWETVWKSNLGIDLTLWNGLLGLEFDIYRDFRGDKILSPDADVPLEYGIGLADENAGEEERYGVDLVITSIKPVNRDLRIQNSFVFNFTRNKQIEIREAVGAYNNPRLRQTGKPSGQVYGYIAEGLFVNQADIDSWAFQGESTLPGDIKYRDINGDGKVDSEDITKIGYSTVPEIMYGYNLKIDYKRFDLGLFIQGTANSSYNINNDYIAVPFSYDKPRAEHLGSWTTDNPDPNAKFPRLSASKRAQNYQTSSFWIVNSSFLRLKSLEFGYNFDPKLTKKLYIKNARIYLNLYNLWTIHTKMPKDFDPETQAFNSYPQQFTTSLGVNVTF